VPCAIHDDGSVDVADGISRSSHFSLIITLVKYHRATWPEDRAISLFSVPIATSRPIYQLAVCDITLQENHYLPANW